MDVTHRSQQPDSSRKGVEFSAIWRRRDRAIEVIYFMDRGSATIGAISAAEGGAAPLGIRTTRLRFVGVCRETSTAFFSVSVRAILMLTPFVAIFPFVRRCLFCLRLNRAAILIS